MNSINISVSLRQNLNDSRNSNTQAEHYDIHRIACRHNGNDTADCIRQKRKHTRNTRKDIFPALLYLIYDTGQFAAIIIESIFQIIAGLCGFGGTDMVRQNLVTANAARSRFSKCRASGAYHKAEQCQHKYYFFHVVHLPVINLIIRMTVTTTTPAQSARMPLFGSHGNSLNSRDNNQRMKPKILVNSFQRPLRIDSTISFKRSVSHLNGFQPEPLPGSGVGVGVAPGSGVAEGSGLAVGSGVGVLFPVPGSGVGLGEGVGVISGVADGSGVALGAGAGVGVVAVSGVERSGSLVSK